MSTTTVDLNRRLSVLEARIGITSAATTRTASSSSSTQNNNNNNVNERLVQLRLNYERKIAGVVANSNNSTTSLLSSTNTSNNNKELWIECIKLLQELDPDIGLTHQQQPLLYKRQQILASSTDMKNDFHQLNLILNLLLKDTRGFGNSGNSSSGGGGSETTAASGTDNDNDTTANKAVSGGQSSSEEQQQQQNKLKQKQQEEEQQRQQRSSAGGSGGNNILRLDQVLHAPIVSSEHYGTTNINPKELQRLEILRVKLLDLNNRSTTLSQQLRHYLECYHTTMQAVSNKIVLADEKLIVAKAKQNNMMNI
jgi:hypothetical protein